MTTEGTLDVARATDEAIQLYAAKRHDEAIAAFRRILAVDPANLVALYQTANAYLAMADVSRAAAACDHALALLPDQPDLLVLRGVIASDEHDHAGALGAFERARALNPDVSNVDARIAEQLCFLGRGPEAIAAFDRAITRSPHDPKLQSQQLYFLNYFRLLDRQTMFGEHRAWGAWIEKHYRPQWRPHDNPKDPERPLKIGLVSGDLRNHSVAFFIEGYLREHDRDRYPIDCFDVSPYAEDAVTARLRTYSDRWHRVGTLDEEALAEYIREQRIDVLVDLSGHTGHNRLLTFAQRPAPVQVSWFGYMNTTGLTAIDYRITDAQHDPPGDSDAYYTEKLFRIPSIACFSPPSESPAVGPAPFLRNGRVSLASINQWTKVTPAAIALWAEILKHPSRPLLRIVARGSENEPLRREIVDGFVRLGVSRDQVEVRPIMPMGEFLAFLNEVDVALDTFPYGGGTTTLHSIWMGVPVIALEGDSELGRATPAMLRAFGLADFAACSPEAYLRTALSIVQDPSPLVGMRGGLRGRMANSPACDALALARTVEAAFRQMWCDFATQ